MDYINKEALYDIQEVSNLLGLDKATIIRLGEMLLVKTHETNQKLKDAILKVNCENIVLLSHDIKGSCSNLRFTKISELATSIEKVAKEKIIFRSMLTELCDDIEEYITVYKIILRESMV